MNRTPVPFPVALASLLVAMAGPALPASGQTPDHAPAVLELPAGTRAMAMGDAFMLPSDDSDGVFHNPATAADAGGTMLGVFRLRDAATALTLSAATEWFGGGVGVGLQALEFGASGAEGAHAVGGIDRVLADGPVAAAEWAATAAYARAVGPLAVGVGGKLLGRRLGETRDVLAAVDVGATTRAGPLTVGLAARNLSWEGLAGDDAGEVPDRLSLGAALDREPLGPLDVGGAVDVSRRADGEWLAGGGLEVAYWPVVGRTFIVRAGLRTVPEGGASIFRAGAAYEGDDLVLEWAFQPVDAAGSDGAVHRFSLGWR